MPSAEAFPLALITGVRENHPLLLFFPPLARGGQFADEFQKCSRGHDVQGPRVGSARSSTWGKLVIALRAMGEVSASLPSGKLVRSGGRRKRSCNVPAALKIAPRVFFFSISAFIDAVHPGPEIFHHVCRKSAPRNRARLAGGERKPHVLATKLFCAALSTTFVAAHSPPVPARLQSWPKHAQRVGVLPAFPVRPPSARRPGSGFVADEAHAGSTVPDFAALLS